MNQLSSNRTNPASASRPPKRRVRRHHARHGHVPRILRRPRPDRGPRCTIAAAVTALQRQPLWLDQFDPQGDLATTYRVSSGGGQ